MTAHVRNLPVRSPSRSGFHVVIVGGGIGGLTLAQGLKKAGISVAVYERDRTPTDRVQGYRVHINPAGSRALHTCLPSHLFEAFAHNCGKPGRAIHFLTENMKVLLTLSTNVPNADPIAAHRSVSRITLRQVLLSGLDGIVQFGKTFTRYDDDPSGRVVAHFEDGTTAEGDILVAADGGGSRVRGQFLPYAKRIDTGVVGVAGKIFLDGDARENIAPVLLDGLTLVSAKGGVGLFAALQEFEPIATEGIGGNDESARFGNHFDNTRSYLMWALSARREQLGVDGNAEALDREILKAIALRTMADWSERFRDLVHLADPDTINLISIRTSVPVAPWRTGRITLLGDAIHSMTPYGGIGANVALKDAMRLCEALVAARNGERELLAVIHAYEDAMIRYGFAAVEK
ncbi:MAG: FAD-dependent monooxygenase, partial [Bradyrhizobiaceae bacterium]|nr:FAD-dependent monooxygenase [Bradyrhizobiaceae bacterium]